MKLSIFLAAALLLNTPAVQASTSPGVFVPVKPNELMVVVPGLEFLGLSRISSVQHCQRQTGARDWMELQTDAELEGMNRCLADLT